jgi:multisubunit Na+/H+ antiporter MnhB subunit
MVTQIGTVFSYDYDHTILQTHTLTVVFKTHKAQKLFQLEIYQENNDLILITAIAFLVCLQFHGYGHMGGGFFGVNMAAA